jgi:membrane associated rhomboid family serine protease
MIHVVNFISRYNLNTLGLQTRTLKGLPGIMFSSILHGDFNHLFFNTAPFFVLLNLVLLNGKQVFYNLSLAIIILSNGLLWLFGQKGNHIGASGLIMGYLGYLLAQIYSQVIGITIILIAVCIYYFSGLLLSIFSKARKNISWDSHIFGLLAGIFSTYYFSYIMQISRFLIRVFL